MLAWYLGPVDVCYSVVPLGNPLGTLSHLETCSCEVEAETALKIKNRNTFSTFKVPQTGSIQ